MIQEQKSRGDTASRNEVNSLTIKINQYMQVISSKEEEVVMWENKYTALYTAY